MRRTLRFFGIAGGMVALAMMTLAFAMFPHTQPAVIHLKSRLIGPRLTYAPLASDDDRWEIVLHGVQSGAQDWLQVAADLHPALDTHPGEEMLGAVSRAVDSNPLGAVQTLVPVYGVEVVCGEDEEGGTLDRLHATRRLKQLEGIPGATLCVEAVKRALNRANAG